MYIACSQMVSMSANLGLSAAKRLAQETLNRSQSFSKRAVVSSRPPFDDHSARAYSARERPRGFRCSRRLPGPQFLRYHFCWASSTRVVLTHLQARTALCGFPKGVNQLFFDSQPDLGFVLNKEHCKPENQGRLEPSPDPARNCCPVPAKSVRGENTLHFCRTRTRRPKLAQKQPPVARSEILGRRNDSRS